MSKKTFFFLMIAFLCTSCSSPAKQVEGLPSLFPSTTPNATSAQTVTKLTRTSTYTPTPEYPTPTLNSTLAQIFSSTFDPRHAITRTPSSPQICPKVIPSLKLNIQMSPEEILHEEPAYFQKILDFLNAGGKPEYLHDYLDLQPDSWADLDMTGDGVPELVMSVFGVHILMCENGHYEDLLHVLMGDDPFPSSQIIAISDMNLDGVPELVIRGVIISAGVFKYRIYEWDGMSFQSLIWSEQELASWFYTPAGIAMNWYSYWAPYTLSYEQQVVSIAGLGNTVQDTDGNGTLELIIHSDIPIPQYRYDGPWRKTEQIYMWNGSFFNLAQLTIEPPIYRFQAVEDGDRLSLLGNYQEAMNLYKAAIFDKTLYAWSMDNYAAQFAAEGQGLPTPEFIPIDQEEYNNLAAYARYRIMLLHILQNETSEAQVAYTDLQKTSPEGQPGYLYAELANEFWEVYQSSHNIGEACSAAIKYGENHKDNIYAYLGNTRDYRNSHGGQSHNYTSSDLCPFK